MHEVRALVSALSQSARSVEQRTGITNAQLFVLRELAAEPDLTINALAERAMTGQNTISAVVTRLESHGLVRRGRSRDDGRVVTVALTASGRRMLTRAPEPPTTRLLGVLDALSASELQSVTRALSLLNRGLNAPENGQAGLLFESDQKPRTRRASNAGAAKRRAGQ